MEVRLRVEERGWKREGGRGGGSETESGRESVEERGWKREDEIEWKRKDERDKLEGRRRKRH